MFTDYQRSFRSGTLFCSRREALVEREVNALTLQEARDNVEVCRAAMVAELRTWHELGAICRQSRISADNLLGSRWVLRWKNNDNTRQAKARVIVRSYRDMQANELRIFSGAASRWGHRVVAALAAQCRWHLFSLDVSQVFLRGLPFAEVAKATGEVRRSVQLTVPLGSVLLIWRIPGYEDLDGESEVSGMLRAGFGLKDPPPEHGTWSLLKC